MTSAEITSISNPLVRRLRKLRHRKYRTSEGVFLVEGIAHVRQAIDHGAPIEYLIVAPDLLTSGPALAAVDSQAACGTEVVHLGREAFESIMERDHPSGLAATVRIEDLPLEALTSGEGGLFAAIHDVGNPGNLGSIIRTVDAVGGSGVIVVGDSTDHRHPAAVKASMGTIFTVPVCTARDLDDVMTWAAMESVEVVATSAKARASVWATELPRPVLMLFGSEATGLPQEVVARATTVGLPMSGAASSLNLAVAAGILLYEWKRQGRDEQN
jgi:TrmH family RNA methyltransferase